MNMSIDNSVQRASSLLETGNFAEAEKICTEVLARTPENCEAKYVLALVLASSSGAERAFAFMRDAIVQHPDEDGLLIGFVEVLVACNEAKLAQALISKARDEGMAGESLDLVEAEVLTALISKNMSDEGMLSKTSKHSTAPQLRTDDPAILFETPTAHLKGSTCDSSRSASVSAALASVTGIAATQAELDRLMALIDAEHYSEAERFAQALSQAYPDDAVVKKVLGLILHRLARCEDAVEAFELSISLNRADREAHQSLGNVLCQLHRLEEAVCSYERAAQCDPLYVEAHFNLGLIFQAQKQQKKAISSFEKVLLIKPDHVDAFFRLGTALMFDKQTDKAETQLRYAIALKPDFAFAHTNLGLLLKGQDRLQEAKSSLSRAVVLDESNAEAHNNLGAVLADLSLWEEAEKHFRDAIQIQPNYAGAYNNLGGLLRRLGRSAEAVDTLQLAIRHAPSLSAAHNNLSISLREIGALEQALNSAMLAVECDSENATAFTNLGGVLMELECFREAADAYHTAMSLEPSLALAESQWVHQRQHMCDFEVSSLFSSACRRLGISTDGIPPLLGLTWSDKPEHHLLRARAYCREEYKEVPQSLPVKPPERPARLKIGYFSADFHDFPGMYLMAGLLESHDRERFEVYAFSYGPDKDDAMRRRIVGAVDHFIDIREMSTQEAVDLSREHGIDIALHRNGHTKGSRTELFQHRLAPVQISYLGYPGTLGADFIDYLVADPVVIPEEERQHYSEKIIYLPDTYQPNDNTRQIAETNTTRADFGLPEEGFVLCCFNQNYKISPQEFDIWMRVLGQVEGSVLWLLKSNRWAEENLKKEAERRGIDSSRLIFAEKIPHAEHLARHKHADLFLDTFNYNAHTTASDALWSGLPVVTKQGRQFAARVAASLLTAVGLPELITESEEDYERLILNLAQDRQKLNAIKATLEENRRTEPLFDTQRYTRNLEAGFLQAHDAYHENNEMSEIWV
jgi:protein O-GlcNAc transferase